MHRLDTKNSLGIKMFDASNFPSQSLTLEHLDPTFYRLIQKGATDEQATALTLYHWVASNLKHFMFLIEWRRKGEPNVEEGRKALHTIYVTSNPDILSYADIMKGYPILGSQYDPKKKGINTFWIEPEGVAHHWFKLIPGAVWDVKGLWCADDVLEHLYEDI